MLDLREPGKDDDFGASLERRRFSWLIRLRWYALLGIVLATCMAAFGRFPGVNWQVLAVAAAVAALYNATLARAHHDGRAETGPRAALTQALGDFLLLTVVLWASGGVRSPFIAYYAFHVALAGILAGPRATLLAAIAALACAGFLALGELFPILKISHWGVQGKLRAATSVTAFMSTVAGIAYIVTLRRCPSCATAKKRWSRARDRARLEYEVLSTTLNELDAGLEIVDVDGQVAFKNRLAQSLVPTPAPGEDWHCPGRENLCERDVSGLCPVHRSRELGQSGRCRFAVSVDGNERVYELHSFPLTPSQGEQPKVMNLYVDRTHAMLAERQLLLAERLSSLGRVAQGVAHELNTPLATIRTLAADMGAALGAVRSAAFDERETLLLDLGESAALIHEETGRLGRITHALLAGGDLVRARIDGAVTLSAALERGCALVLAGARRTTRVDIDPSVERISVVADPDRLVQVIVNLVQNASDAVRERAGGRVRIAAYKESNGHVAIRVEDDGPGISAAIQARLFEPFATTKPQGEGTGLGLYIFVHVGAGDAWHRCRSRIAAKAGACATLRLPLVVTRSAA